ncbi:terminase family protein [Aliiroseovarius sp. M344]|uniref:terminase large subunit domain-containing protein n=1 Tax=Aliiroseovarius sp. M344 TaxID=2867010 RepID=UPI0021ADB7BF|nr:terminase family protein [Aliiroseovarius sp. M344]UWQ15679.1 terminase family protein [Aliiroseovarius sp. M344]
MPFDALHDWCVGLERYLDPVARLSHWIGHAPDPWQVEAFTTQASEIALRVGRQAGKTSVLAARAVEELHVPDSLTICVAPAERQAKIIAREIGQQLRRTDLVITRSTLTELEMSNGARVVALPSTSDTIRGYPSVSLLIIDECAFLQGENGGEDLISSVLPMLASKQSQVYFSSTPAGKNNYFARLFLDAKPGDGIHRIVVRGTDIPRLAEKVGRMRRTLSATKFRQEIEVEMISDGHAYFDLSIIEQATSTTEVAMCPKL